MVDVPYSLVFMSALIFLPTVFALVLLIPGLFSARRPDATRWWTLLGTALTLVLSLCMLISYYYDVVQFHLSDPSRSLLTARAPQIDGTGGSTAPTPSQAWVVRYPWIERFNIQYYLGVDGISMPLILLTTLLTFLAMLASWKMDQRVRAYCILLLLLETGVLGTLLALDFFLFFVFWQVALVPVYFLIGLWGGAGRARAAGRFLLSSLAGSALVLVALAACYSVNVRDLANPELVQAQAAAISRAEPQLTPDQARDRVTVHTFDLILLQKAGALAAEVVHGDRPATGVLDQPFFRSKAFQVAIFLALFVGFCIRVPAFPLHRWLLQAHLEAPAPVSMMLAGVLLNTGGYGIIRIAYPLFPAAAQSLASVLALLGLVSIVYGAVAALAQTDFKRLVAYSSISSMGFVLLGIAVWSAQAQAWSWGMNGAMFQMLSHGVIAAGLFFLVGALGERAGTVRLADVRGLLGSMPLYGVLSAILGFAALGLPGLAGAVGMCWIILAAWSFNWLFGLCAALAVVLSAAYVVRALHRAWLAGGPLGHTPDLSFRELLCILPLTALTVLLGVMPNMLFSWMEPTVTGLVQTLARIGH